MKRSARPLRALTYLAPGIPLEFFESVTSRLASALGCEIELESECRSSGPMHGDDDPFRDGRADLGFLCSPSYLYLRAQAEPSVELVPAAFVFADPRHTGEPVYFSDVVVRTNHPARTLADLAGGIWGYNDECSLSGYFSTLQELDRIGSGPEFFGMWMKTGSHLASIRATLAADIDGAAIDSVALSHLVREQPELRRELRVLESFGPFPIQPMVVRAGLDAAVRGRLADALLTPGRTLAPGLEAFGFEGCVPIADEAYAEERRALVALGKLPATSI